LLDVARGGGLAQARAAYEAMETNASDCIACGDCEGRCPFGVPVTDLMEEAVALFA
ncbi:MAG: 4Fe-4S binding protein, partial [Chloroflexi bacterium]|nr:4Fe-4S binding protein [Chloroflexota bacterium]